MGRGREPRPQKMHERKGNGMNNNVTRRNFLLGSATIAGLAGLAGCSASTGTSSSSSSSFKVPSADKYPIDPDGSDVKAKWTSEQTRDEWYKITQEDGAPTIGVMDEAKIIQVDGYAFRDMNGSGKLELWEDWRQSADDRAAAFAASLSAEDIFPLVWAGGTQSNTNSTDTSDFDWIEQGSRAGVSRLASSDKSYAADVKWINDVQSVCEKSELGIPYFNYSDPYVLFGVPSSFGLAAAMDKDLWRKAGMWQARAWRATGVRCELGPQIDVYSNPIGVRTSGSVSEDPALNRDFAAAFGGGMQSTWGDDDATDDQGWGDESCGVMLKHFVGEGCPEGGRNDHTDMGKWSVFPGSNFNAHLIPFMDGGMNLDSKTGQMLAVMPCYGIDYDPNDDSLGEHVGSAYSAHNMSILRNAGWDGMLCTDWLVLTQTDHGVANLTEPERFAKLMKNSISQHGGIFDPDIARESFELMKSDMGEDDALAQLQDNARRIFKAMITVDLFDQPYSDRSVAKDALESEAAASFGEEAANKCVVMIKNKGGVITEDGFSSKPKVYIPRKFVAASKGMFGTTPATADLCFGSEIADSTFNYVTDALGDPSGTDSDGAAAYQETDITRLTAAELADVKYAIVAVNNPTDAYQGVQGGKPFNPTGGADQAYDPAVYKPLSLQYRPYTADGDYVRKQSLNPADEYGVYENRSVFGQSTYAKNESELDLVISIRQVLPADAKLILLVTADRPMCYGEIEPYADAILMGFGSSRSKIPDTAFANVITGAYEPSGLLSFQMPKDMKTVMEQDEDVPRDMECYVDSEGNTYDFCFGLNWSGVIDDDRVKTYKVDPLTAPETEVKTSDEVPVGKVG